MNIEFRSNLHMTVSEFYFYPNEITIRLEVN